MLPGKFMVATSPTQAGTLDSILSYFADDLQTGFETVLCFVSFELLITFPFWERAMGRRQVQRELSSVSLKPFL